jgi:hypothetical protein
MNGDCRKDGRVLITGVQPAAFGRMCSMPSLKLRRDESGELDPIPFPSRAGRSMPTPPRLVSESRELWQGDSIAHAEAALSRLEKGMHRLAEMVGTWDPDRPRAA